MLYLRWFISTIAVLVMLGLSPARAEAAENDETVLETSALIHAPVDAVWTAMTSAAGLESWMVAQASVELRVGGKLLTRYAPGGHLGDEGTIVHTLAAYDPRRMLAWKPLRPPAKFPFKAAWLKTWHVIYFSESPDGTTKVTSRMLGFDETAESRKMREFFVAGNRETFTRLQQHFQHP